MIYGHEIEKRPWKKWKTITNLVVQLLATFVDDHYDPPTSFPNGGKHSPKQQWIKLEMWKSEDLYLKHIQHRDYIHIKPQRNSMQMDQSVIERFKN